MSDLGEEIKNDPALWDAWQANIAMAIYDTRKEPGETAHEWRNRCACTFLNRLCGLPEGIEDLPGALGLAASVQPRKG